MHIRLLEVLRLLNWYKHRTPRVNLFELYSSYLYYKFINKYNNCAYKNTAGHEVSNNIDIWFINIRRNVTFKSISRFATYDNPIIDWWTILLWLQGCWCVHGRPPQHRGVAAPLLRRHARFPRHLPGWSKQVWWHIQEQIRRLIYQPISSTDSYQYLRKKIYIFGFIWRKKNQNEHCWNRSNYSNTVITLHFLYFYKRLNSQVIEIM